jgi:hypothetical protein
MSMFYKLALAVVASTMAVFATTPSRANSYAVDLTSPGNERSSLNPFTASITGVIDTDGTLGRLGASNITFFGLGISFTPNCDSCDDVFSSFAGPDSSAGGPVLVTGSAFTAMDDGLFFDFSNGGTLVFDRLDPFGRAASQILFEEGGFLFRTNVDTAFGGSTEVGNLEISVPLQSPAPSPVLVCRV